MYFVAYLWHGKNIYNYGSCDLQAYKYTCDCSLVNVNLMTQHAKRTVHKE